MEAALGSLSSRLSGACVALQGAGRVGSALIPLLLEKGARVVVADPDEAALAALPEGVEVVPAGRILHVACDVLAPCGPPGILDAAGVSSLRCRVVCGAANNPLASPDVATMLGESGILYVPDYLSNAGGLIHLAVALEGGDAGDSRRRLEVIVENLEQVLTLAKSEGIEPAAAAEKLALAHLAEGGHPRDLG
jgi:glutamate dehydrogenase/leucine dehydrogenase